MPGEKYGRGFFPPGHLWDAIYAAHKAGDTAADLWKEAKAMMPMNAVADRAMPMRPATFPQPAQMPGPQALPPNPAQPGASMSGASMSGAMMGGQGQFGPPQPQPMPQAQPMPPTSTAMPLRPPQMGLQNVAGARAGFGMPLRPPVQMPAQPVNPNLYAMGAM